MRRHLPLSILLAVANCLALGAQTPPKPGEKPAPIHLDKVTFIVLGVANVDASARFYHDMLGLKVFAASDDTAFVDAGTIRIVLSSAAGKVPGDSEVVFGVDRVTPAFEALRGAGVAFVREPHEVTEGSWAATFRDPDGHLISLFGPR